MYIACGDYLRETYGMTAQMIQSISKEVAAKYKTQWTKLRQHQENVKLGRTKKRYRGLDNPIKFTNANVPYQFKRDYSLPKHGRVRIKVLEGDLGSIVLPYKGYDKHTTLILGGSQANVKLGASQLWYDKPNKQFYLLISMTLSLPDVQAKEIKNIVGVDHGVRRKMVAGAIDNQTFFTSKGGAIQHKKDQMTNKRAELQKKGTRGATRRLVSMSRRERRMMNDVDHKDARKVVKRFPKSLFVREELTHIRERTNRHHSKKASTKQRAANRRQSQWGFANQQAVMHHQAIMHGSVTTKADANNTSKGCINCGHTTDRNRPNKGLIFHCELCGYEIHVDLSGGRSLGMRGVVIWQDWVTTGTLSTGPNDERKFAKDVTSSEAKAARLKKYAELRWSSVTSPYALAMG